MKVSRKNIFTAAALVLWAAPAFALPAAYGEAAGRWTAEQALRLPGSITPAYLKEVELAVGQREAAALFEKREKVSALLERYKTCALGAEDLKTAEKYFTEEFKGEIGYFAGGGCAAFREAAAGLTAAPSADLEDIENFAASGQFATGEGSARFFDGASVRAGAAPAVGAVQAASRPASAALPVTAPPVKKRIFARVPMPQGMRAAITPPERPADLGKDGRVHKAMAYWLEMRRANWNVLQNGELKGAAKAKAAGKLAAGAVFHGLLWLSNLDNVEIAAARLGWDVGSGAGAGVIASDAAKLIFHSAVFALMLAPIPLSKVAKAALAGQPWAIAFVGAMAAGPINRYWLHFAD